LPRGRKLKGVISQKTKNPRKRPRSQGRENLSEKEGKSEKYPSAGEKSIEGHRFPQIIKVAVKDIVDFQTHQTTFISQGFADGQISQVVTVIAPPHYMPP
jgi:hypothetical protein